MMFNFNDVNRKKRLLRSDQLLGRALRLPLRLIPKGTVLPILQGPGAGLKWITGSYNHGCWLGSYEFEKQRVLPDLLNPGDVVYDIGAHVGYFTIICAKLVGQAGQVVAFEPFPANFEFVLKHVSLNRLQNVQPLRLGVGGSNGLVTFEVGGHTATGRKVVGVTNGSLEFRVVNLVDYIHEGSLRVPNLVKMDIEGAELEVVPTIVDFMVKHKVKLLMSTHSDDITRTLLALLRSRGFKVTPLQWANQPVEKRDDNATLVLATL